MGFVVAVDGPAGSGKGTITKKIAKELNRNKFHLVASIIGCLIAY